VYVDGVFSQPGVFESDSGYPNAQTLEERENSRGIREI
jgi:hypothetical protein